VDEYGMDPTEAYEVTFAGFTAWRDRRADYETLADALTAAWVKITWDEAYPTTADCPPFEDIIDLMGNPADAVGDTAPVFKRLQQELANLRA